MLLLMPMNLITLRLLLQELLIIQYRKLLVLAQKQTSHCESSRGKQTTEVYMSSGTNVLRNTTQHVCWNLENDRKTSRMKAK
jgi:hypothetical protein